MTTQADARDALAATKPGTSLPRAPQRTRLSRMPKSSAAASASPIPSESHDPVPTRSPASKVPPATTSNVPNTSATRTGSSSTITAIAADRTGDTPTKTAVRDGPISPPARVKKIWLIPGANKPVTKNGHVSAQSRPEKSCLATARTMQQTPARNVVTSEAVSASSGGGEAGLVVGGGGPDEKPPP